MVVAAEFFVIAIVTFFFFVIFWKLALWLAGIFLALWLIVRGINRLAMSLWQLLGFLAIVGGVGSYLWLKYFAE